MDVDCDYCIVDMDMTFIDDDTMSVDMEVAFTEVDTVPTCLISTPTVICSLAVSLTEILRLEPFVDTSEKGGSVYVHHLAVLRR